MVTPITYDNDSRAIFLFKLVRFYTFNFYKIFIENESNHKDRTVTMGEISLFFLKV